MTATIMEHPGPDHTAPLLDRLAQGDSDARNQLLIRDLPWLEKRIAKRLGDQGPIRQSDVLSDVVLKALDYLPRFRPTNRRQWRGLLERIALNMLVTHRRRLRVLEHLDAVEEREAGPSEANPLIRAISAEERELLRLALLLMDPGEVGLLHVHMSGQTDAEIGEQLGINANAVRARRIRARRKLLAKAVRIRKGTIASHFEIDG